MGRSHHGPGRRQRRTYACGVTMSGIDEINDAMKAVVAGRGTLAQGLADSRAYNILCLLYEVKDGNCETLYRAMRDLGDPTARIKEMCLAAGESHLPRTLSELLNALEKRKVVFRPTAGGAPTKWTDELQQALLERMKTVKAGTRLSDGDALRRVITTNPKLLK